MRAVMCGSIRRDVAAAPPFATRVRQVSAARHPTLAVCASRNTFGPSDGEGETPARDAPAVLPTRRRFGALRLGGRTESDLRDVEVMHSRWAMLGVTGVLALDALALPMLSVAQLALALVSAVELRRLWRGWRAAEEPLGGDNSAARDDAAECSALPGGVFGIFGLLSRRGADDAPPLCVYAPWAMEGVGGWLLGGAWWCCPPEAQARAAQEQRMKATELRAGRIAMLALVGCTIAPAVTGVSPLTCLREHIADPAHTTLLTPRSQPADDSRPLARRTLLMRAPPLLRIDDAAPQLNDPAGGDWGEGGGGGDAPGRACVRRPSCVWGDFVCRALLGERWGPSDEACDTDTDDVAPEELRGEGEAPAPFVHVRVST